MRYGGTTAMIGARVLAMSMRPAVVTEAVGTTGFESEQDKPELGRVVAFARLSAPILVRAAEHGDPTVMQDELLAAAETVGLPKLAPARLIRICLQAAASAELTLRGELGLAQMASVTQVEPITTTQASLKKTRRRDAMVIAAGLATALGFALTLWLLRH